MYQLIFVNGTGVREPTFGESFCAIEKGLNAKLSDFRLHPCFWSDTLGSDLHEGCSIPAYRQAKALGEAGFEDESILQWSVLLDDPLIELKLIASQDAEGSNFFPPGYGPHQILRKAFKNLRDSEHLKLFPSDFSPCDEKAFQAAIDLVLTWDELDTAVRKGVALAPLGANQLDAVRLLAARAIVASWIKTSLDGGHLPPSAEERDQHLNACFQMLGGGKMQGKGLGGDLLKIAFSPLNALLRTIVIDPSKRALIWGSKAYRHSLTNWATPAVGDILLYQAKGKVIRDFIAQKVEEIGQPVILIAHSLGGIASVELLIEKERPKIKALITLGSQAPYLYEIGALSQLAYGEPLPAHMPPWLNFYDPADLLAFVGEPLMKGGKGVRDIEVSSGQPFPMAHSAYWKNERVWEHACEFIRENLP